MKRFVTPPSHSLPQTVTAPSPPSHRIALILSPQAAANAALHRGLHMRFKQAIAAVTLAAAVAAPAWAAARRNIHIVGSSTVYPFATSVAERFARANPSLRPPVIESTGTGAGMKLFCGGVGERFPDIANASRRMKASEARLCQQHGVTKVTEIQVGLDGIVMAGSTRSPALALTTRDIYLALAATPFGKPNRART